jgi:hypothetical protein
MLASTARTIMRSPKEVCAILLAGLALAVVPQASTASTPLVQLGPVVVANGTAVVSGTVGSQATGVTLNVNGQPLGVDAAGHFAATVVLNGASSLELALTSPGGSEQTKYTIPLTGTLLGPGGIIPAGVLDAIEQAGVSLLKPVGGGNEPFTIAGSVLDRSKLAGLTVNGIDVLGALAPDGTFAVQVPATTKAITLTASDARGVSQTTLSQTPLSQTAVPQTPVTAPTVSAANAVGVRIVRIRYVKTGVLRTHRVRMILIVKDTRGLLIQGAKIVVRATKAHRLAKRPRATLTSKRGGATVTLRLRRSAFGKRLATITVAKTPTAKTRRTTAINVPRLR